MDASIAGPAIENRPSWTRRDAAGRPARNPHVSARFIGNGVTPVTVSLVADDAEGQRSESPPHAPHSEKAKSVHLMRDGVGCAYSSAALRSEADDSTIVNSPVSGWLFLLGCLMANSAVVGHPSV